MMLRTFSFTALTLAFAASVHAQQVESPDGTISVLLRLDSGVPSYEVSLAGPPGARALTARPADEPRQLRRRPHRRRLRSAAESTSATRFRTGRCATCTTRPTS